MGNYHTYIHNSADSYQYTDSSQVILRALPKDLQEEPYRLRLSFLVRQKPRSGNLLKGQLHRL